MSKKATESQRKSMSLMYRGTGIFHPLNTGWVDDCVACVREWVANVFLSQTGEVHRKVLFHLYKLPAVKIPNHIELLQDGQFFYINDMKVECFLVPGHTGFTENFEFAFAHKNKLCSLFKKMPSFPDAPYDAYDESDDTEQQAKAGFLKGVSKI